MVFERHLLKIINAAGKNSIAEKLCFFIKTPSPGKTRHLYMGASVSLALSKLKKKLKKMIKLSLKRVHKRFG
jgi:hypothetical protein